MSDSMSITKYYVIIFVSEVARRRRGPQIRASRGGSGAHAALPARLVCVVCCYVCYYCCWLCYAVCLRGAPGPAISQRQVLAICHSEERPWRYLQSRPRQQTQIPPGTLTAQVERGSCPGVFVNGLLPL